MFSVALGITSSLICTVFKWQQRCLFHLAQKSVGSMGADPQRFQLP